MSVTTLLEIEGCPRKWALSNATFPKLWAKSGYPPKASMGALKGSIVHNCISVVIKALDHKWDICSISDQNIAIVLKELGGFTKIINNQIDHSIAKYQNNPRAQQYIKLLGERLRSQVVQMRIQIQNYLIRILSRLSDYLSLMKNDSPKGLSYSSRNKIKVCSELEVQNVELHWIGYIDLLILVGSYCEIVDFKTGAHHDNHSFQLFTYALLWYLDRKTNPLGVIANRLTLLYSDMDKSIDPPTEYQLNNLENDLKNRTVKALQCINRDPPKAALNEEVCRYCQVRHLCDDYWLTTQSYNMVQTSEKKGMMDIEATIIAEKGSWYWEASVLENINLPMNKVLIQTKNVDPLYELKIGDKLRIIDTEMLLPDNADDYAVLNFRVFSEVFIVDR